jgi:hypothetical protein
MHNSGGGASPCSVPYLYKPTNTSKHEKKRKKKHHHQAAATQGEEWKRRLPVLIAARTINSCATTSLFLMFYIRMAAYFEGEILYS